MGFNDIPSAHHVSGGDLLACLQQAGRSSRSSSTGRMLTARSSWYAPGCEQQPEAATSTGLPRDTPDVDRAAAGRAVVGLGAADAGRVAVFTIHPDRERIAGERNRISRSSHPRRCWRP